MTKDEKDNSPGASLPPEPVAAGGGGEPATTHQPPVEPAPQEAPLRTASGTPATPAAVAAAPAGLRDRVRRLLALPPRYPHYDMPPEPEGDEPERQLGSATLRHPVQTGFMGTVGVGLALLGYFVLTNVGPLLVWISLALFIALGLDPIVRWLEKRGAPRPLGVVAAVLLLAAAFAAVFATLIPTMVDQTAQFVARAPGFVDDFLNSEFFLTADQQFQVRDRLEEEVNKFFSNPDNVGGLFGGVIGAGTVIAQGMFGALTVLVLAVYFLASLPAIKVWAYRLAPRSKRNRVQALSEQITNSVGNYVIGQAFVALANATYAFILMSITDVPFSLLLAVAVALLAFIPLVGAVTAGILVSLVALTAGWQTAVVYAVFYFAYLQFEAYFISPRVMQKAVAVPGAVAVIAVIAGGALMGIVGALMAIPLAAASMLLLREVFIARQDRL
ncbi:AI-2E family transporter [Zafaria sp. Z1313]|uniref:AI-2E family transporter n=1 Tax=unclassified Zafaria TaxID=2828765 RepID=UPI003D30363D